MGDNLPTTKQEIKMIDTTNYTGEFMKSETKTGGQIDCKVSDDCERLYISEFDYFVDGQKKYYHIKVINRTDKFIEFEWVWSGAKQLMPLTRFNAIYKIEEELASNSR